MRSPIIDITIGSSSEIKLSPVWQYDRGLVFRFHGITLSDAQQAHFSTPDSVATISLMQRQNEDALEVDVPDGLVAVGLPVSCCLYSEDGDTGMTIARVTIPVIPRHTPGTISVTRESGSAVAKEIAVMRGATETTDGVSGLVPAPGAADYEHFLAGDGTWRDVDISHLAYTLPPATEQTLGGVKIGAGLSVENDGTLSADVQEVDVMTGATSSQDGISGLVPAPESADRTKYLRGNGTWGEPPNSLVVISRSGAGTKFPLLAASIASPTSGEAYSTFIPATASYRPTVRMSDGMLSAAKFSGDGAELTNLNAGSISTGTIAAARIPSLDASKIGSGTLSAARLPAMGAASAQANGSKGAVPAPQSGDEGKFLRGDGTWAAISSSDITIPTASANVLGGVRIGARLTMTGDVLSADVQTIPTASETVLGGVIVGSRLSVSGGVLSADDQSYTLPAATSSSLGGVMVGDGLTITDGVLAADVLPAVTSEDNGKVLMVVNGAWAAVSIANASGVSF